MLHITPTQRGHGSNYERNYVFIVFVYIYFVHSLPRVSHLRFECFFILAYRPKPFSFLVRFHIYLSDPRSLWALCMACSVIYLFILAYFTYFEK
jgi:hypothetical protein